jgi:hypothetical protein
MGNVCCSLNRRLFTLTIVADIIPNTAHKESRLLADQPELTPQPVEIKLFDVPSVDKYLPFGWVVEPHQQLHDGRLATARVTHQCDLLSINGKAQFLQNNLLPLRVFEGHVSEFDISSQRLLRCASIL